MAYRFGKVTYQNFGPFEKAVVDFSRDGLTIIEGQMDGVRGCDSNGSGKSFLLDGIAWATFGRCIRGKYAGDEVMRRLYDRDDSGVLQVITNKKGKPEHDSAGTAVTVELVGGPQEVYYTRYRKHPTYKDTVRLFVGGQEVTRGRNNMTLEAIETILGMDFTTFSNSVAFGARDDIKSFFSATDTERKQILDRILGLEVYSRALTVARDRLKASEESLEPLLHRIGTLRARLDEQKSLLSSVSNAADEGDIREQLAGQKVATAELESSYEEGNTRLQKMRTVVEELKDECDESLAAYDDSRSTIHESRDTLAGEKADIQSDIAVQRAQIKQVDKEISRVSALLDSETCPTCEQSVPEEFLRGLLSDAGSQQGAAQTKIDGLQTTMGSVVEKLDRVGVELRNMERPTFPNYDKAVSLVRDLKVELRGTASRIEYAKQRENELATQIVKSVELKDELKRKVLDTRDKLKLSVEESVEVEAKVAQLELCVEMFGNGGIKSFIIEASVPEINRSATVYVRRLCGEGATVQLRATTSLKSNDAIREKLSVVGSIPGCADTYEGASKGQKKRLDLALLLAYREIVANRSSRGVEQLFADELFDGLDRSGMDGVVDLLRELAATSPVIMVTHDERLKSAGDRMILVRHSDGKACVVGSPKKKKVRRKVSV